VFSAQAGVTQGGRGHDPDRTMIDAQLEVLESGARATAIGGKPARFQA
jgi:hypothetical protein